MKGRTRGDPVLVAAPADFDLLKSGDFKPGRLSISQVLGLRALPSKWGQGRHGVPLILRPQDPHRGLGARFNTHSREKVTDAVFTFVAIDENGCPRPAYAPAILKVGILRLFMGCLGFLRVRAGLSMS